MSTFNATIIEESPLEEIDPIREEYTVRDVIHVFLLILTIGLQIAIISSDIFLIYVICKYRRLRTRINTYILNCAIINLLISIAEPLFIIVLGLVVKSLSNIFLVHYIFVKVHDALKIIYVTFAFGLALDWFVSLWRPNIIQKYNKYYKYVFLGVYVICALEGFISMFYSDYQKEYIILSLLYAIILVTVIVLHIFGRRMKPNEYSTRTAYPLTTSYIILLSFSPLVLVWLLHLVSIYHTIILDIGFISSFTLRGHPILVVYMLGRQNKHFKMAYQQCFKQSLRRYGSDNLDDVSERSLRRYGSDNLDDVSDDGGSHKAEEVKVYCANGNVEIP